MPFTVYKLHLTTVVCVCFFKSLLGKLQVIFKKKNPQLSENSTVYFYEPRFSSYTFIRTVSSTEEV